jgi:hypothetical protein
MNEYAMPSERLRLRKELPEAVPNCLSDDIKTAQRGFVGYLRLISDVVHAIGCLGDEDAPIRRLGTSFTDALNGAEVSLFKSDVPDHRPGRGFGYQDAMGLACALINTLQREQGIKYTDGARKVAQILAEMNISIIQRNSDRDEWKTLLDKFHVIRRKAPGYKIRHSGRAHAFAPGVLEPGSSPPELYRWNKRSKSWDLVEDYEMTTRAVVTYVGMFNASSDRLIRELKDVAYEYGGSLGRINF